MFKYLIILLLFIFPNRVYATNVTSDNLFFAFNSYRLQHNLRPLSWDYSLCEFAGIRVAEIPTDWSHAGFYKHYPDYMNSHTDFLGENLARGFTTTKATMTAWNNSPAHKANLVNPLFNHVCFAVNGSYVAQELSHTR